MCLIAGLDGKSQKTWSSPLLASLACDERPVVDCLLSRRLWPGQQGRGCGLLVDTQPAAARGWAFSSACAPGAGRRGTVSRYSV